MNYFGSSSMRKVEISDFMYQVYGWMSFALAVSASVSYYLFKTEVFFKYLMQNQGLMWGFIILQLGLVVSLGFFIKKMSFLTAISMFVLYAASVGVTLTSVFFVYTQASIYSTFLITAGTFAAMALYGYFTNTDLTKIGSFAIMGLFGLIIGSLVNLFFQNSSFDFFLSIAGILIFIVLTAYDVQKIKQLAFHLITDRETQGKISIICALTLYLDFINLFIYLLRFFGKRRND